MTGLYSWFQRGLSRNPDGIALRVGRTALSYGDLRRRALAAAAGITDLDPDGTPRVGILAGRSVEAYVGVLGAACRGATVVPLSPDFPLERTESMAAAAGVSVLITDAAGEKVRQASESLSAIPVAAPRQPRRPAPRRADPDGIAYIVFTTGSSRIPKGVPVGNANVDHYLRTVHDRYGFGPDDAFSQTFELTFDLALFDLFAAWGSGGTLVVTRPSALAVLPQFLAERRITVWFSTPSSIAVVRRSGGLSARALPTLRWSLFSGEPLPARDAEAWLSAAPGSIVENLYGPAELTISCSVHRWDPLSSPAQCSNGIVPIGIVHSGLRYLLADDAGSPTGETGELCISGPQVIAHYLDPSDGEQRFLERDGARWYRTGDLVRTRPDGQLVWLGRRDDHVRPRGHRVEPAEIDHALRGCAGVEQAVTVVVEDELIAYYTGRPREPAGLRAELATVLPQNLVPCEFRHVVGLPLNANGTVDHRALRALARPDLDHDEGATDVRRRH
jgi:amino acid adenylation domain-containing protein